jgi:hypothetical protein
MRNQTRRRDEAERAILQLATLDLVRALPATVDLELPSFVPGCVGAGVHIGERYVAPVATAALS